MQNVGADGEVVAIAGDDEALEISHRFGSGVRHRRNQGHHIAADCVLERVQFDAADAVPEIDQRSAGVAANHFVGAAEVGNPRVAGDGADRLKLARRGLKALAAVARVPRSLPCGEHGFHARAYRQSESLHALDGGTDAGRIPHFKRAKLPVEAGAHRLVDRGRVIGRVADTLGRKVPQRGEKRPEKRRGLVLLRVAIEQLPELLRRRLGIFRHFERRQRRLLRGTIFKAGKVQSQAVFFAIHAANFLVETLPRLVTQPSAPDDLFKHAGKFSLLHA